MPHTLTKSGLRAESAFPNSCSDAPLEAAAAAWASGREWLPATGSPSKSPVGLCLPYIMRPHTRTAELGTRDTRSINDR